MELLEYNYVNNTAIELEVSEILYEDCETWYEEITHLDHALYNTEECSETNEIQHIIESHSADDASNSNFVIKDSTLPECTLPHLELYQEYSKVEPVIQIPLTVSEIAKTGVAGKQKRMKKKRYEKKCFCNSSVKQPKKNEKPLWQFLLDILDGKNKSSHTNVVTWVNRTQGLFKILDGQALTEMWVLSRKKLISNRFDFLERALRHYYRKGILHKIGRKKHLYQFGKKITW